MPAPEAPWNARPCRRLLGSLSWATAGLVLRKEIFLHIGLGKRKVPLEKEEPQLKGEIIFKCGILREFGLDGEVAVFYVIHVDKGGGDRVAQINAKFRPAGRKIFAERLPGRKFY